MDIILLALVSLFILVNPRAGRRSARRKEIPWTETTF